MRFTVVAAFSAIPLQWFLLAETPAGDIRLHQLAAIVLTALVFLRYGVPRLARGVKGVQLFIIANIYMLILWFTLNFFNGLTMVQPLKQTTYLATFIAVTAVFYFAIRESDTILIDTLRWTASVGVAVLIAAFGYSMLSNGVNPIDVVQRSIEAGDPNILHRELFRSSFVGFGYEAEEARGNLRHEVFGGLLFTMYVAAWAVARRPLTILRHRNLYRASMVIGSGFLLISLSRSILFAAALWPTLAFLRAILIGRVSPRQQLAVIAGVIGAGLLAISGFLELLWTQFTEETKSYSNREDLIALALERIQDNFWLGGIDTDRTSAHNFVLDMWQRGGIFVGLPAVFIFLFISFLWLQLLLRTRTVSDDMVPLIAAVALPCVRMVTQGGGSLQIVEWLTLAFVMGILAATRDQQQSADDDPASAVATAPDDPPDGTGRRAAALAMSGASSGASSTAAALPRSEARAFDRLRGRNVVLDRRLSDSSADRTTRDGNAR